ncbi:MAG: hypothetical protein NPIRA02_20750 [Nitrospirales bacterium]|nr:MAG: hypothetical protein NPIRA02_20750 [Nitrospirales bacterium]
MINITGSVAIITGAAGNLGHATAQTFREAGARLVLIDRSIERLRKKYPDLTNSSDHFLVGDVDLTDPAAFDRVTQDTVDRFGRLDVLINTVGGLP